MRLIHPLPRDTEPPQSTTKASCVTQTALQEAFATTKLRVHGLTAHHVTLPHTAGGMQCIAQPLVCGLTHFNKAVKATHYAKSSHSAASQLDVVLVSSQDVAEGDAK